MLARLKNKLFHRAKNDFKANFKSWALRCNDHYSGNKQVSSLLLKLYRDIAELLLEHGIKVDHSTINPNTSNGY